MILQALVVQVGHIYAKAWMNSQCVSWCRICWRVTRVFHALCRDGAPLCSRSCSGATIYYNHFFSTLRVILQALDVQVHPFLLHLTSLSPLIFCNLYRTAPKEFAT